jgi:predicted dehydrogenase
LRWCRTAIRESKLAGDYEILLANPKIDAIAISTPVSTHFDLAMRALRAGKHVLVEKPLAPSSADVLALIEEAERRKLVLMVDHLFVYTGAVRRVADMIRSGRWVMYYYDSVRINLGLFQHDVDIVLDPDEVLSLLMFPKLTTHQINGIAASVARLRQLDQFMQERGWH